MYLASLKIDKATSTRNINRTDSSIYSMRINIYNDDPGALEVTSKPVMKD